MKNAIIQYYIPFNGIGKKSKLEYKYQLYPEKIPEWAEISSKRFKEYAKENDADYFLFQDKFVDCEELHFQALRLYLDPILDSYDKILYCDIDVVPKNMKENIFNLDVEDVAGWSETKSGNYKVPINWQGQSHFFNQRCNFFDSKAIYLKNVGHSTHCIDQPFLNVMFNKYDFDVKELGIEWNRTPTKDEDYPCNFAHYTGNNKKKIIELYG